MSILLNSRERFYAMALGACLLGLAGLFASGCSDHGPVGNYSEELFHKHVNGPQLVYYAANQISFTTQDPTSGFCFSYAGPPSLLVPYYTAQTQVSCPPYTVPAQQGANGNYSEDNTIIVTIANGGGSGTYGPVQATFSSNDPNLVFEGNPSGSQSWAAPDIAHTSAGADQSTPVGMALFDANPPVTIGADSPGCDCATAVSTLAPGAEILPFAQTSVILSQGYFPNNNSSSGYILGSQNYSVAFYYTPNCGSGYVTNGNGAFQQDATIPVLVSMTLKDGLGNVYSGVNDQFFIYITQYPGNGGGCPCQNGVYTACGGYPH